MEQSCYVASLKYSPVMWNHGRGLGQPIGQEGFPIRYLLASGYEWLCENSELDVDLISLGNDSNPLLSLFSFFASGEPRKLREMFRAHPPSMVLFVNFNPLIDRIVVRIARAVNPNVRVVALFHEPHTEEKLVYGWKRALLLTAYEFLSKRMVRLSDAVILPSEHAGDTFRRFIPGFRGDSRIIPLVYVDVACEENLDRRFVSFVGQIGNAHQKGLDLFIEMVEENVSRSGDLEFQLVTGQSPQPLLESLSAQARASLRVVHAERLTDEVISQAIRESVAVFLLQRRVMQSGALPMAFMNGTPVLVSRLRGFTEFVEEGRTAQILPVGSSVDQRFDAIGKIRENIDRMAPLCRRFYEEKFDSRSVAEHVSFLVGRPRER